MSEKKRVLFLSNHFKTLFWFRKELIKKLVKEGHTRQKLIGIYAMAII